MSKKFIIYKGSGGLAHMLRGLQECIRLAKDSNRFLIIDCKSNNGFGCNFSEFFKIDKLDYSDNYNVIPPEFKFKGHTIDEVKKIKIHSRNKVYEIFENNISDCNPNVDDDIVIFGGTASNRLIEKMTIIPEIMRKIESEPKIDGKYISVHFRNTDLSNNIMKYINKLKKLIKDTNIKTVYWSSDDCSSYDKIVRMVEEAKIIRYTIPEKNIKKNIHTETKDKNKQIYDCLKDIYFILKSDYFIPSKNSGMSLYIELMIKGKNMYGINSKTIIIE